MRNCAIIHPLHLELETANQINQTDQTNQIDEIDQTDETDRLKLWVLNEIGRKGGS